jgi:hypothetical protein
MSCGCVAFPAMCAHSDALTVCVICQEEIAADETTVQMGCDHKFHGQCLVNHLQYDVRCPICRYSKQDNPDYMSSDEDEEDDQPVRVTLSSALKLARKSKDKNVKKSLATIRKWKTTKAELKKKHVTLRNALYRMEDEQVDEVAEQYERRLRDRFNRNHRDDFINVKTSRLEYKRAQGIMKRTQTRLAKKFGFEPRLIRSMRRSRNTFVDDFNDDNW